MTTRTKRRRRQGTKPAGGLPSTRCTRQYRVAAADTLTPPPDGPARLGHLHAERAERQLRARLAAGERPPVVLLSPEQATPARIDQGGRVRDVFAWAPPTAGDNGLRDGWTHCPHVTAQLDAVDHAPDPASDHYAAGGSVLVRAGRLRRLHVSGWLAPVAGQLAEQYGVPVDVDQAAELPEAPSLTPGAVILPQVLPALVIEQLVALPKPDLPPPVRYAGYAPPRVASMPPWDDWSPAVAELLFTIGDRFGLPVNACQYAVLEYLPGDVFAGHTDRTDDADHWDRTVSLSLLLSEPGRDFRGGQFEVEGQPVELRRGDLIGFTAVTRHAVRPITWGRRLVLVAFGEWRR